MDPTDQALLDPAEGLVGNVDRSRRRQVTMLEREAWSAVMDELGANLDPSYRRANILISGISLANSRNHVITIGDATVLVGGEVTPCERMEQALPGLQNAMRPAWRGGVFAQVLTGGMIRVGDPVGLKPMWAQADGITRNPGAPRE
jgi:MOSC domain-containing protein YiiM